MKDNVHLLTPKLLDEINTVVAQARHSLVKKKEIRDNLIIDAHQAYIDMANGLSVKRKIHFKKPVFQGACLRS